MSFKLIFCLLGCCALSLVNLMSITQIAQAEQPVRFICSPSVDPADKQIYPTTYALTDRGKIPVVRWRYRWFGDTVVTLQGRCQTVSSAFQYAYDTGNLSYISNTRNDNGQPVVCATGRFFGRCNTILFALRTSFDSLEAVSQVQSALEGHRVSLPSPRILSDPQIYYSIDMMRFLQSAPVEQE